MYPKNSMESEFWINLSSKDISSSKIFFERLGFSINKKFEAPHMLSIFLGNKKIVLNLFTEDLFQKFIGQCITDTNQSNEVLFSLGTNNKEEVDKIAKLAEAAGAEVYAKPSYKDNWMYGCAFRDLDGHRWNILYMDMSKMPKAQ